jgi:hypothetical protein
MLGSLHEDQSTRNPLSEARKPTSEFIDGSTAFSVRRSKEEIPELVMVFPLGGHSTYGT